MPEVSYTMLRSSLDGDFALGPLHVNASVGDNELLVHRAVHLGIAVDINFEGLIVPVVHDADGKRLRSIARELADLAARARSKKLNADERSPSFRPTG